MLRTKCVDKLNYLKSESNEIESAINESYERQRYKKEMEVISYLKSNPKIFYKFARTKSLVQSDVGPHLSNNKELKTDRLEMAEVLVN